MAFDWPHFLRQHNIHYVTRGPNTGRGRISVRCPWCQESDPSEHMGISLKGSHWGCLRNSQHRGKGRARLIQALLRCSFEEAQRLSGEDVTPPPPLDEDLAELVSNKLGVESIKPERSQVLKFPIEFKPLAHPSMVGLAFYDYLNERGYTGDQILWLSRHYNLQYTVRGLFRYRLIIPIYGVNGALLSWTGRTIIKEESTRYKTLSLRPREGYTGEPLALDASSNLLLGLPMLWRAKNASVLVLCEGPFDALRISVFGHQLGVYGTCLFGLNVSDAQVGLLEDLTERFKKIVLLLDPDASMTRLRIWDRLSRQASMQRLICFGTLPNGVKDPGELSEQSAVKLIQDWRVDG